MLTLLFGRGESEKMCYITQQICKAAGVGVKGQILLVPEQYSHDTERQLCRQGGNSICLYAEVLTFKRLTNRVLASVGGLARRQLDEGGRLLVMQLAVDAVRGELKSFALPARKPDFLKNLLDAADELKCYRVSGQILRDAAENADSETADKLRDLSLVLEAYDALCAHIAADPRDALERTAHSLDACGFADGAHIYIDGFAGFTAQEFTVLEKLMKKSAHMTVALTCDGLKATGEDELFSRAADTAARLIQSAVRQQIEYRVDSFQLSDEQSGELAYLGAHLFEYADAPYENSCKAIELYTADTVFSECEYAAHRILELVREQGFRYREIAVMARSFEDYAQQIETVFERYGIPVFIDSVEDVLQKPVLTLIVSALDALCGDFEYEPMFRYLKCGLADITQEACDLLENYVLCWGVRGSMWTRKRPWDMNVDGYGAKTDSDDERLAYINTLREQIMAPFLRLKQRLSGTRTAGEQAAALYDFMEDIQLRDRIVEREALLRQEGKLKQADEYRQLWQIVCTALEQCTLILNDTHMELERFAQLFKLVLSSYSIGTIPVSLDRVTAGSSERMRRRRVRCVIMLGANDGSMPLVVRQEGLISDDDREWLWSQGIELKPTSRAAAQQEMDIIYASLTLAREKLIVSWPRVSAGGGRLQPSFVIERIRRLFPDVKAVKEEQTNEDFRLSAPIPGFDFACSAPSQLGQAKLKADAAAAYFSAIPEYAEKLVQARTASAYARGPLSEKGVRAAFGRSVRMSASRMEKYRTCRYAYFMQFGLRAKPRQTAGFQAPEIGTFIHYILENTVRSVMAQGGFSAVSREEIRHISREYAGKYAQEVLHGLEDKPARFKYLYRRLLGMVDRVVDNMTDELSRSAFTPLDFELHFSDNGDIPAVSVGTGDEEVSVTGFADRVDGWIMGDKLYVRVVDYKTGIKAFNLTDIWHGLGVQMLMYLFALEQNGSDRYGKQVIPAGVMYIPVRDVLVQAPRNIPEETLRALMEKKLKRSGILLDSPEVIEAMEQGIEGEAKFIPVKISKDGQFGAGSSLASLEQFGRLRRHMEKLLRDIGRQIRAGSIETDPYYRGHNELACEFCDFAQACHFDPTTGRDKPRYLYKVSRERFWELIGKEVQPQ